MGGMGLPLSAMRLPTQIDYYDITVSSQVLHINFLLPLFHSVWYQILVRLFL
jgi:hypothetical protein